MGDNKYNVVQVYIESAAYNLLVLQLPENEIIDKLTYLSREKGLIPKSLYHDFLISHCIANLNEFLQHLSQKGIDLEKLNEIRAEMVEKIIEHNPKLDPDGLIVNTNHVVKLKGKVDADKENFVLLTENEFWNKDIYKETEKNFKDTNKQKLDTSKIKNIKDLEYITVQKFWKRLGQYITIKQFEEGAEEIILSDRGFDTRHAYEQYIITICIDEIEDLFVRLDKIGLPKRVDPTKLIEELYELCIGSNPFLDYEVYKEQFAEELDEDECGTCPIDPFGFKRTAEAGRETDLRKERKTKLFKHVKKEVLLNLADSMKKKIKGQDTAIEALVDAIHRASIGLRDPEQPIGAFIFTGYSGIGKTYTAKILAEELMGDRKNIIVIDCSEYTADHEYAKLIGAPSGYIGHEHGGYLTNAIKKQPFSVVLFDEVEKASEKVHQLLLQVMDEARLTDGKGNKVSFRNAVIIMTSNLGVKEVQGITKTMGFGDVAKVTDEKHAKATMDALKKKFKPEFLNRVTATVDFKSLGREEYYSIIELELDKLKMNLKLNKTEYSNMVLDFDESVYNFIYENGVDPTYGARPLKRTIERELCTPLSKKLLEEKLDGNCTAHISIEDGQVKLNIEVNKKIDDPPFYMKVNGDSDDVIDAEFERLDDK